MGANMVVLLAHTFGSNWKRYRLEIPFLSSSLKSHKIDRISIIDTFSGFFRLHDTMLVLIKLQEVKLTVV